MGLEKSDETWEWWRGKDSPEVDTAYRDRLTKSNNHGINVGIEPWARLELDILELRELAHILFPKEPDSPSSRESEGKYVTWFGRGRANSYGGEITPARLESSGLEEDLDKGSYWSIMSRNFEENREY